MSRRVLVTGGAGYLGSVVVEALLNRRHSVRVLDALCFGRESLEPVLHRSSFELVQGDIRDAAAVRRCLKGMEMVVHLAAIVGDPACARNPEYAREVNLEATLSLFGESCRANVSAFVLASTCSNYGVTSPIDSFADEETGLAPLSVYAQTKVDCEEQIFQNARQGRTAAVALRFATLYGLSQRMRFDLTVNDFTMQMLTKKRLVVHAGDTWRPYIHVADAATAVCEVLDAIERTRDQVYNVGSTGQNFRKTDIVDLVKSQVPDADIQYLQESADRRNYRVRFDKLAEAIHFAPARTVSDGIAEIVRALRTGVIQQPDSPIYRN